MVAPVEPTDEQVEQFVETHPGGCTLDELAAALCVSKQRAKQLVDKAINKVLRELRWRQIYNPYDVLG